MLDLGWTSVLFKAYVGKPRSDLDQHAHNEKKLLIKNAIKKFNTHFSRTPNTQCVNTQRNGQRQGSVSISHINTQWSAVSQCITVTYQYAIVSGQSVYQ